jgi:5-dehydro-2-deoxygluconokinase
MTVGEPAARAYDVLAMGRSSIDLYAHEIGCPITDVRSFDAYVGGCPTNVSVGTRRLGLRSALLTAVGDDQVGDFVTAFLEREGVETRFIPRKTGRRRPHDSAAGSISADVLPRQLCGSLSDRRRRRTCAGG